MECYASRVKSLSLLGLTCIMVGLACFCALNPEIDLFHRAVGWFGIAFFGLGFIVFPRMFFRISPVVVIDDEGIEDRRGKMGVIRWEDIRSLSVGSIHSAKFLCIEVVDPEKYLSRLPRWQRSLAAVNEKILGFPTFTISFAGLSPGLKDVWAYIDDRIKQADRQY